MQKRSKRILAATLAAAGVLVASGIAYATWVQADDVAVNGSSETFKPITLSGEWLGRDKVQTGDAGLLPGESGVVKLTLPVSANNTINARIATIIGTNITADHISGTDNDHCAQYLSEGTYTPTAILAPGTTNEIYLLRAVKLIDAAPVTCQGMTFQTEWTVSLEPDRTAPTGGTSFDLSPSNN
ncbi:hypothetical protein SAMN05421812_113154 [Asanoa hainanensis]|uniref:SipW-cognate class signal peptide n=1 Tax=Asanoa hainanensis TaxID=560556 RepID=A0A239P3N3_9ACTN|nr:hypothetical protein [Asanoa hainanensis]SNT61640.1 hypothetical protein SAMN05421812_113154 [Asanoa hainanensis]